MVGAGTEDSSATGVNGDQQENTTLASGAAYIFIRDSSGNWSQQAYLKASNTESSDGFGFSVSIFGDTIAVGAAGDDSASTDINSDEILGGSLSGAVYVFERDNAGIWTQQYYVKASNTGRNDEFNIVSLSADTLVVGAPFEDSGATGVNGDQANDSVATRDSGAVYVFKIR